MIICFVTWGESSAIYFESIFSILTFLGDPDVETIAIVTEKPDMYAALTSHNSVRVLACGEFGDWTKETGYPFRCKIKALMHAAEKFPGEDLLFLDTDTFRGGPLQPLVRSIRDGKGVMHELNGEMRRAADGNNKKIWRSIGGKTVGGVHFAPAFKRYNSGVIGLRGEAFAGMLAAALTVTDALHVTVPTRFSEEVAYSAVMQQFGEIVDCADIIGHYYGNKPAWHDYIIPFLAECYARNRSVREAAEAAAATDFTAIETHLHVPRKRRQAMALLDRFVKPRRQRFFPQRVTPW